MKIERVHNGYIVTDDQLIPNTWVFNTLEEVFNCALMNFERRTETGSGDRFGRVHVVYDPEIVLVVPPGDSGKDNK